MKTKLGLSCMLILGGLLLPCGRVEAASVAASEKVSVQELIAQLGNDQYLLRQRAETQLLQRGAEVFAELQAAEKNADLEVATRARYILNQISIEWLRPTDSAAVQAIMGRYGELSAKLRLAKIRELAKLEDEQGFAALCRIARFDTSSGIVTRYAAVAILDKGLLPTARTATAIAALREELGEDEEAPCTWIDVYADQLQSPQQVDPRWLALIDEEIELLSEATGETDESLTLALMRTHINLADKLSDEQAILASLERRIQLRGESELSIKAGVIDAISWLVDRAQWGALSLLEDRYASEIKETRRLLYHVALAREKQGRVDDAQKVADEALNLSDLDFEERNACADLVANRGHYDWAEHEWDAIVEAAEATDLQSLLARQSLGMYCVNDRLEHKAAADLLTEAIDAIEADPQSKEQYTTDEDLLSYLTQARSNRDFFLAAHYAKLGEHEKEREYLEQAYQLEPANADIIIAMFQSKDASEAYRKKVRTRRNAARDKLEKEITQVVRMKRRSPELDRYLAHKCNHWAWLVSNTDGDFKKAVKYSQRSLELQPGSPSYLDTLGRCYFAADDIENALKVQQEAVSMQPHLMVMQRQLQLFKDELQKRAAAK